MARVDPGDLLATLEERLAEIEGRLGLHTWLLTVTTASTAMPALDALFGA